MSWRGTFAAAVLFALVVVTGCSRFQTGYGPSTGSQGRKSLNGFAAFRDRLEQSGIDAKDVPRLNKRNRDLDALVWTPKRVGGIRNKTSQWLRSWLRGGGKTLVYVVPDSGSELEYLQWALQTASPDQRIELRRRVGHLVNLRVATPRPNSPPTNGWFELKPLPRRLPAEKLSGPWEPPASSSPDPPQTLGEDGTITATETIRPHVEWTIEATDWEVTKSGTQNSAATPTNVRGIPSTDTVVARNDRIEWEPLVSGEHGIMVVRMTSERWRDSQVIIVAGGSLLNNFAMSTPWGRSLADHVRDRIKKTSPSPRVGFALTEDAWIPVRQSDPAAPVASGMEVLTTWPLSLLTMHALVIGVIACLAMLPIFGRPGRTRRGSLSHFGGHLDAVATLMTRNPDEDFARSRIAAYRRQVRGEENDSRGGENGGRSDIRDSGTAVRDANSSTVAETRDGSTAV